MIKVLYMISSLEDNGPVRVLYNILQHIDMKKYDVYLLALSVAKRKDLSLSFISLGVKVRVLDISRIKMFFQSNSLLSQIIKDIKPDIVHTHCFRSTIFMQYFNSKVKLCTTIHVIFYEDFVFTYGWLRGNIMTWLYAKALKKYEYCIACSATVEKALSRKYVLKLIHIRNGIQIPEVNYEKDNFKRGKKRINLGLPEDKNIFICTGVICARKNQIQILRCLSQIDDICVVFLGDGPDFKELSKTAFNKAVFAGNVNNVYEYLSIADGFVSASFSEGMPNAVLEALMMGLPCLLSNIKPHCEIKTICPEACYLYEIMADNELIAGFHELISISRNGEIHERISKTTRRLFSSDVMSREYQSIYDNIGNYCLQNGTIRG